MIEPLTIFDGGSDNSVVIAIIAVLITKPRSRPREQRLNFSLQRGQFVDNWITTTWQSIAENTQTSRQLLGKLQAALGAGGGKYKPE